MKFKVGDKVRVRQWKAMKREFGVDGSNRIEIPCFYFVPEMAKYCGKSVTIDSVVIDESYTTCYKIVEDNGVFSWTDDMFEDYVFEYGDRIEVSNDGNCWQERIYVGYIDGDNSPYLCVIGGEEHSFYSGKNFDSCQWSYARPIQKKHTIIIDGKEIEISEESYKKLKESLLK